MPKGLTDQGEDKELGDALDGELLVGVANREEPPLNPGDTHAEGAGRRRCEGRNIVRDGALVEIKIALVAGRDEGLDVSIGREHPGRHSLGLRTVIGERAAVHIDPLIGGYLPAGLPPGDRARPDRWCPPTDSHAPAAAGPSAGCWKARPANRP